MSGFSSAASADLPAYALSLPIVSNTGTTAGLNVQNSIALRTVKNFVINAAFAANLNPTANPDKPTDPDKPDPGV